MDREAIQVGHTYTNDRNVLFYVQDIEGQNVTYTPVGTPARFTMSLGRFAGTMAREVPNQ